MTYTPGNGVPSTFSTVPSTAPGACEAEHATAETLSARRVAPLRLRARMCALPSSGGTRDSIEKDCLPRQEGHGRHRKLPCIAHYAAQRGTKGRSKSAAFAKSSCSSGRCHVQHVVLPLGSIQLGLACPPKKWNGPLGKGIPRGAVDVTVSVTRCRGLPDVAWGPRFAHPIALRLGVRGIAERVKE